MKVFIRHNQSHPLYDKIAGFFRQKKWEVVEAEFGTDYVVVVECNEDAIPVDPERLIIVTKHITRRIGEIKSGEIKCFALVELRNEKGVHLPDGSFVGWNHFVEEHCTSLDVSL